LGGLIDPKKAKTSGACIPDHKPSPQQPDVLMKLGQFHIERFIKHETGG